MMNNYNSRLYNNPKLKVNSLQLLENTPHALFCNRWGTITHGFQQNHGPPFYSETWLGLWVEMGYNNSDLGKNTHIR